MEENTQSDSGMKKDGLEERCGWKFGYVYPVGTLYLIASYLHLVLLDVLDNV